MPFEHTKKSKVTKTPDIKEIGPTGEDTSTQAPLTSDDRQYTITQRDWPTKYDDNTQLSPKVRLETQTQQQGPWDGVGSYRNSESYELGVGNKDRGKKKDGWSIAGNAGSSK